MLHVIRTFFFFFLIILWQEILYIDALE
jgi:hypothetical protein